jgi:acylphosphatase
MANDSNENEKRIHAYVSGKVQGVFFRDTTRRKAMEFGVTGWVKNLPDGRVEVVAEGTEDGVDKLEQFLHEGSRGARVEEVELDEEDPKNEFNTFKITY